MIPKIMHFVWMQGLDAMPPEYRRCFNSWAPKHPDWEIKLWSRANLPLLRNSWILKSKNPTLQCEIIRFELVYAFGGMYFDADIECLHPIDKLLVGTDAIASKRNARHLENNGFGATAKHPWMKDVLDALSASRAKLTKVMSIDGPFERTTIQHPEVRILPFHVFHPDNSERAKKEWHPKAFAIHHRFSLWMDDDDRYVDHKLRGGE
jgi:mannosyltransferase OCH1-like enzyme